MKVHSYIPRDAKILKRYNLSDDCIGLRLAMKDKKPFNFSPGQFVMLSVLGFGEIPIGITTSPDEKGYFEAAVRTVGMVSQKIARLREGELVGINGPFGNGYPLSRLKGKDVVLVAGGIGIFPLRSLIHHLGLNKNLVKSLTLLYGAKTPRKLIYRDEYNDWSKFMKVALTVDESEPKWKGNVGIITDLYDQVEIPRGAAMIVCGPPIMYRSVIARFAGKRIADTDLYFMLERRMKCGIGKCQHCTCGKKYVCLDGPVFSYQEIKYDKEALS